MADASLRNFYPGFTALGLLVAALVALAYYKDQFREWKLWQRAYVKQELARAAGAEQREAAARIPIEIKQLVLPELNRVDRCVTCHVAVEDPSYGGFPQPLAYHPNHAQHPFEKFGCTICHQGQGRATTKEAAHGRVAHWERPMLPMKYIESSCAKCHLPSDVPQAPKLARGRAVFEELGCIGCHKLHGSGGVIGAELEDVGARRGPEWLLAHFKSPAAVTPGSAMPPIKAGEDDLDALTLYVLSFTGERMGAYYVSAKIIPDPTVGRRLVEPKIPALLNPVERGKAVFKKYGCAGCHSRDGGGGVPNPNAKTAQQVPSLKYVADSYTQAELKKRILDGQREIVALDPQRPPPPLYMPPWRGKISESELDDLIEYLMSLFPKEEKVEF